MRNLRGYDFFRGLLPGSRFEDSDLTDATFKGDDLKDIVITDSILRRVNFRDTNLLNVIIKNSKGPIDFRGANMRRLTFSNCDLSKSSFAGAKLSDSKFENCILSNANFTGATIINCSFIEDTFDNTNLNGVKMIGSHNAFSKNIGLNKIINVENGFDIINNPNGYEEDDDDDSDDDDDDPDDYVTVYEQVHTAEGAEILSK